jgi:hypothetical protein
VIQPGVGMEVFVRRVQGAAGSRACGGSPPHEGLRSRNSRHLQCCPFWCLRGIPAARHYPRGTGGGAASGSWAYAVTCERAFRHKPVAVSCSFSRQAFKTHVLRTFAVFRVGPPPPPPPRSRSRTRHVTRRRTGSDAQMAYSAISMPSPRSRRRSTTCTAT